MPKTDLINQYDHTWRVFNRLVKDFSPEAWVHTGRGAITPARLSLHILQSTKYYMQCSSPAGFPSGKPVDCDWVALNEADLPSQEDLLACSGELRRLTRQWLSEIDLDCENTAFPWAGKTRFGVILFMLRHSQFHIGELSSLLNESRNGEGEDHYVKALNDPA